MNIPKIKPLADHLVVMSGHPGGTGFSNVLHAAGRGAKIVVLSALSRAGGLFSGAGSVCGAGSRPPKY